MGKNDYEYQLVQRCLSNDRQAHEEFYNLHADKMFSVCMQYANNRDEACDFLQDGYMKVFSKLHQFNFDGSLEGWVRRVVVNTALSNIRKNKKVFDIFKSVESLPDLGSPIDVDVEEVPSKLIVKLVNELPYRASIVLKLYTLEGYTHQEISEILDISVGTSKSQLSRARSLLKIAIKNAGF